MHLPLDDESVDVDRRLRLGTCGWSHPDWKGVFYPPGTKDELAYYASRFDAVEVDTTYYRLPSARMVSSWYRRTPEGFLFCPKLPGEITHERKLVDVGDLVAQFAEVISLLQAKLGPILVQLHPSFPADELPRLARFLRELPADFRYVVEFRHRSWLKAVDARDLLRELGVGIAMAHHPWYPRFQEVTTDFAYLRLLGRRNVFPNFAEVHRPQDDVLREWAEVLKAYLARVTRTLVFANNQFEGHSPSTIARLRAMFAGPAAE